jgi:hypothetical protein
MPFENRSARLKAIISKLTTAPGLTQKDADGEVVRLKELFSEMYKELNLNASSNTSQKGLRK